MTFQNTGERAPHTAQIFRRLFQCLCECPRPGGDGEAARETYGSKIRFDRTGTEDRADVPFRRPRGDDGTEFSVETLEIGAPLTGHDPVGTGKMAVELCEIKQQPRPRLHAPAEVPQQKTDSAGRPVSGRFPRVVPEFRPVFESAFELLDFSGIRPFLRGEYARGAARPGQQ